MKVKIVFSYDGTKFNGFQRQNNVRSVQKEIEDALNKIYHHKIEIKGSGRTDVGVHANNQVAHFETDNYNNLKNKLNSILLPDICIKKVSKVSDDFHARYSVKKKCYIYKINLGPYKSSLNGYYYQPNSKLDIKEMISCSKYFIGQHDFQNFVSGQRDDYVTTIYKIKFLKIFNELHIIFIGKGFYRYMVRNIVGALIEVGKQNINKNVVLKMINNPSTIKSLPTAASEGLYLAKIWY